MADLKQSQFPAIAPTLTDDIGFISDPLGTPANGKTDLATLQALIGGGSVDSVNSQTGVVVIDADDVSDTLTTNKFTSASDTSKLAGIETAATADQTGAEIKIAYEAEVNTNAFTDVEQTKLDSLDLIESFFTGPAQIATSALSGNDLDLTSVWNGSKNFSFNADGTKLAILRTSDNKFTTYNLSTPFDPSTGMATSESGSVGAASGVSNFGIWNPDGTKFLAFSSGEIFQYSVASPYNLSIPTLEGSRDVSVHGILGAVSWSSDGNKILFNAEGGAGVLFEYNLSTPFDIISGSFTDSGNFFDLMAQDNTGTGFVLNPDEDKIYYIGGNTRTIFEYSLPTPGTLVGMSFTGIQFATSGFISTSYLAISNDGSKLLVSARTNLLRQIVDFDMTFTPLSGYIKNVVEDTTPQLGGVLDANSNTINNLPLPVNPTEVASKEYVDLLTTAPSIGLSKDFVLNEDIVAGSSVALRGVDGRVEKIFEQAGIVGSPQNLVTFGSFVNSSAQGYDEVSQTHVVIYKAFGGFNTSFQPYNLVGGVITPVGSVLGGGGPFTHGQTSFDPINQVVYAASNAEDGSAHRTLIDLSGVPARTNLGSESATTSVDIAYDSASGKHIQLYLKAGNWLARTITVVSKTSEVLGPLSDLGFAPGGNNLFGAASLSYDVANSRMMMFYNSAPDATVPAIPAMRQLTISGTNVVASAEILLPYSGGAVNPSAWFSAYDPDSSRIGVFAMDASRSPGSSLKAHLGWIINGEGITLPSASPMRFLVDTQSGISTRYVTGQVSYDETINSFILFYHDKQAGGEGSVARQFKINAALDDFESGPSAQLFSDSNSFNDYQIVTARNSGKTGKYLFLRGAALTAATAVSFQALSFTNSIDYIGIMSESGLATETKLVNLRGGIDNNQSALTIGADYFLNSDGTISTTSSLISAGKALSTTTLQLSGI